MIKRISLLVTAALLVATMAMAGLAGPAFAAPDCGDLTRSTNPGIFERTCVEETVSTFEETVNTSQQCQVGNSGRTGTQQGTQTNTFEVTTTTTTKEFFQGNNLNNPRGSEQVSQVTSDPVLIEEGAFVATGDCKNTPGRQ